MRVDPPLLQIQDLRVAYGNHEVVAGVSFTVEEREILGLVGESGSGKSQILLAIMGLIQDPRVRLTGSIRLRGQELIGLPPAEMDRIRGRHIAMILQDPMTALTPVLSIEAQITEQIRAHTDLSRRAARNKALALLDAVGIAAPRRVLVSYPHQLSGGMRQRIVIAMALSCDPALLLADEPTTALDVTVQAQILALIGVLRAEFGLAVIFVTHDLGVVATLADRVAVLYAGRFVEQGSRRALFDDARHPYSQGLLASIPRMTGALPHRLPAIPGAPPARDTLPEGCAFAPRCGVAMEACRVMPTLQGTVDHRSACWRSADS